MDQERHEKADKIRNDIATVKKRILSFKAACEKHDSLWIGENGNGVYVYGKTKELISKIVMGTLSEKLQKLEWEYKKL